MQGLVTERMEGLRNPARDGEVTRNPLQCLGWRDLTEQQCNQWLGAMVTRRIGNHGGDTIRSMDTTQDREGEDSYFLPLSGLLPELLIGGRRGRWGVGRQVGLQGSVAYGAEQRR